jgi:hypothetical protein
MGLTMWTKFWVNEWIYWLMQFRQHTRILLMIMGNTSHSMIFFQSVIDVSHAKLTSLFRKDWERRQWSGLILQRGYV